MAKLFKDKIVLIGMPGSGKTTIGKVISKELNYNFYDMDNYIENISGKSVDDLFKVSEDMFRDWESKACHDLANKKKAIISSGGGVVKRKSNIDILNKDGLIIFIDRPIENIINDIDSNSRPLLKGNVERLYELYDERYELYKEYADIIVRNDSYIRQTIDEVLNAIKQRIKV